MPNNEKLSFGILGCGVIGPTHAGAISQIDGAQVVAVADVVRDRATALAAKFGISRIYTDHRQLVTDSQIDIVCICTPSGMHADHACAALEAGKHVIVEKPMEISLEACDRIIAAQRRSGRQLAVISQHRFDAASMLVKDTIVSGKLGRLVLATADVKWWRTQGYYDSGDWRGTWKLDGGGALMNQGVHTVDLLQWLAGDVSTVYAQTRTAAHQRIEVEDVAAAVLSFAGGGVGTITATTAAFDGLPVRIDLFGTEGTAILEGDRLRTLTLTTGETFTSEAAAEHAISVARGGTASVQDKAAHRPQTAPPGAVWGDAHRAQIQDFIRAVRAGGRPLIDATEGRKPIAVIQAVYTSARTGQPVKL